MLAKLQYRLLAATLQLPRPLLSLVAGPPIVRDGQTLDLHCQALLKLMQLSRQPSLESAGADRGRRYMDARSPALSGEPRQLARVEESHVVTPEAKVPIRIYAPQTSKPLPALVYAHGGGFVLGSITSHDRLCRIIADEAQCVVISVHYRRAPESQFPAALDDALASYRWVRDHATELGVIVDRIAVGGDSAGANLMTGVCQTCVATGEAAPRYQWLIYPVTDVSKETRSYKLFEEGFYLTRSAMEWFTKCYLRSDADRTDPRVSPLLAPSLSGLPAAWVMTAGFDPLRDEGTQYAQKLASAGVEVKHQNYPSLIHGVFSMTGIVPAARSALTDGIRELRAHLS